MMYSGMLILSEFCCMDINEIFINNRKINKKNEGVYQQNCLHLSCQFPKSAENCADR